MLKDQKRTKGKARLATMLRQQRPMAIYTIKKEDCPAFARQAKQYGVLYAPIPVKRGDDTLDILVFQDDAARVNRIVERLELTVLDTASIENHIQQSREDRAPFPERTGGFLRPGIPPGKTRYWAGVPLTSPRCARS